MFFKHFASKNQLHGFYISGTLVENVSKVTFTASESFSSGSNQLDQPNTLDRIGYFKWLALSGSIIDTFSCIFYQSFAMFR